MVVTLSSTMSASAASFHVGLRSPKQNYAAPVVSFHVGPKRSEQQEMIRWPHPCMQMTNFTWLTSCSCGWVVCVLEMLSAKTSLTSCNCGCNGGNTLPVVATTSKTSTWPQVCVWNAAGRKKKVLKHAKINHAETRRKKKHAGRYTCCRASSFAASSVARSGPLNVLPSFLRRARQPLASFSTAMASRNKCKWLIGIVVVVVVTLSSAMSASAASFHVGLRSPKQNYAAPVVSFHVGPKGSEQQEMIRWPHLCMQMTNFTWLTSCSCGWVVCMLEMLSAKTSLTTCTCGCSDR